MSRIKVAFDFNISHRMVTVFQELYGYQGFEFLHLEKLVQGRTPDPFWADVYKQFGGQIVISGDCRIAYKPHEAIAFIDNGFISFFPAEAWSNLKGHGKTAALVYWWPAIVRRLRTANAGTCWRIPCDTHKGELWLRASDLEALEIPQNVLEEARKLRAS